MREGATAAHVWTWEWILAIWVVEARGTTPIRASVEKAEAFLLYTRTWYGSCQLRSFEQSIYYIEVMLVWKRLINSIIQGIDITAAVLLLTGQITIRSVIFVSGGSFRLSLSGPILGTPRSQPKPGSAGAPFVLDAADVITAFLLILGEIGVVGLFIESQRLSLLVTGPPFGGERETAYTPSTSQFFGDYRDHLSQTYKQDTKR